MAPFVSLVSLPSSAYLLTGYDTRSSYDLM